MSGYYITDLFDVLDAKKRIDAEDWLSRLSIETAPHMKEDDFRKTLADMRKQAGLIADTKPKFDEARFEQLKLQLKFGM